MTRTETRIQADGFTLTVREGTSRQDNIRPGASLPRLFVWVQDENILDNLMNRHARPVPTYRRAAKAALAGLGYTNVRLRWSQKAGCSCPCSPGFIVEGAGTCDIDVTIEATEQPVPTRRAGAIEFPSSDGSRTYTVLTHDDGTTSCNCPGWTFKRQGQERNCKHTRQLVNA